MKQALLLIVIVLSFTIVSHAQAVETLDIATFKSPKGWNKQPGQGVIHFSTEDKATGGACLLTLFKSLPSIGNSKENFNTAWETIVTESVSASAAPQMFPSDNRDGWALEGGFAPFEKDGAKGAAILYTISGHGKMVNVLIVTNTQAYEPTITAFMESISLKKPAPAVPQPATSNPGGSHPELTLHYWRQTQNRKDTLGNYAGFSSNTYQFGSNNTYKFSREDFQSFAPKYYLEDETGTYQITGNKITLTPRKSTFSSHRINKEDPPSKSGNLQLTTLQYSFEIVNVNSNPKLLLSPVDGNETKRDGHFSFWLNGEKTRSYAYASVNAKGELILQ